MVWDLPWVPPNTEQNLKQKLMTNTFSNGELHLRRNERRKDEARREGGQTQGDGLPVGSSFLKKHSQLLGLKQGLMIYCLRAIHQRKKYGRLKIATTSLTSLPLRAGTYIPSQESGLACDSLTKRT